MELTASNRAPGLHVAPDVVIPDDARIAPHVTIYAGVELGSDVSIEQGAIVGRPQRIDGRSRAPLRAPGAPTSIGDGCHIGSGTVVVAGARVGAGTSLSDLVLLRESAVIGAEAMLGRGTCVARDAVVGDRTRTQHNVLVGPRTTIGEDVLVSPRVTFVGDPTMGRRHGDAHSGGIVVGRASRVGTAAVIVPPVQIGEEAVVAAQALVRADVPARTVVVGTPARHLRDVRDDELLERWAT